MFFSLYQALHLYFPDMPLIYDYFQELLERNEGKNISWSKTDSCSTSFMVVSMEDLVSKLHEASEVTNQILISFNVFLIRKPYKHLQS